MFPFDDVIMTQHKFMILCPRDTMCPLGHHWVGLWLATFRPQAIIRICDYIRNSFATALRNHMWWNMCQKQISRAGTGVYTPQISRHYLNQCWHIVNTSLRNNCINIWIKIQLFPYKNIFENVFCKVVAILSRHQYGNSINGSVKQKGHARVFSIMKRPTPAKAVWFCRLVTCQR